MQLGQQGLEHVPTRETRAIVSIRKQRGLTNGQVAESLGICENTLLKHYDIEVRTAKNVFTDKVFGKLAEKIEEGSEKSIHFYMTHQAKWVSGDKEKEVDALKENTAALERKRLIDEKVAELRADQDGDNG